MSAPGIFIWGLQLEGLGEGSPPVRSRAESPGGRLGLGDFIGLPEADALCRYRLQLFTAKTIKI